MISKGKTIKNEIRTKIQEVENKHDIKLSTTEKILLSISGPIVTILDTLYGEVKLFVLEQKMKKADKEISELLDIDEGAEIDYREVIVHKHGKPLVYAISYIPKERCSDSVIDELLNEEKTTGRILVEHEIETIRRINNISIEKPDAIVANLFNSTEKMLAREYVMVHKKKVVIWTKEIYPISQFK